MLKFNFNITLYDINLPLDIQYKTCNFSCETTQHSFIFIAYIYVCFVRHKLNQIYWLANNTVAHKGGTNSTIHVHIVVRKGHSQIAFSSSFFD